MSEKDESSYHGLELQEVIVNGAASSSGYTYYYWHK